MSTGRVWTWTKIPHGSLFHVHQPANLPGTTSPDSLENFFPISTCLSVERLIVSARHIFSAMGISFMLREPGHFRVVRRGGISRGIKSVRVRWVWRIRLETMAVGMSATTRDPSSHLLVPTLISMLVSKPLSPSVIALRMAASAPPLVPTLDPNLLRWDQNPRAALESAQPMNSSGRQVFDEEPSSDSPIKGSSAVSRRSHCF